MKRFLATMLAATIAAALLTAGCAQSAPAPAPTQAPAAPKAAEPTKAPAAAPAPTQAPAPQPTAVPAKKVDYPGKGKSITLIVPWTPGGPNDVGARFLGQRMEKEFGVPVEIQNKAGAGSQIGATEMALAKPDGLTLMYTAIPTLLTVYLDPERKAAFGRKNLQPVALHAREAGAISVKADSPMKTVKDYIDAAKANPGKVKSATSGFGTVNHMALMTMERNFGFKAATVHFDSTAPGIAALLGAKIDALFAHLSGVVVQPVKNGDSRVLGVMDKQRSRFIPEVSTFEEQGYAMTSYTSYGLWAPGGTPKEITDMLANVVVKAAQDPEHQKQMNEAGMTLFAMDTAQFTTYVDDYEAKTKEFMELSKNEPK